jgi:hypothetical protein
MGLVVGSIGVDQQGYLARVGPLHGATVDG